MLNPMNPNAEVQAIRDIPETYRLSHSKAKIDAYRQNSGSIRIRIIDPHFWKLDKVLRHDQVW